MSELKPCPFCGSEMVSESIGHNGDGTPFKYIECEECASMAMPEVWNHRSTPKQGEVLSDERIDFIADTTARGMEDGIRGFCRVWGWRQFARALLQDCAGYYAAPPQQVEPGWVRVPIEPTMAMRSNTGLHHIAANAVWRAMIAAAPKEPKP